ncbi:hypothetical protein AVEN_256107-1 [Araneus ventricosus]|uniref:Uncharacterized protein n=1 Tax=Araneus ventricosus TaxID=182803 RepID=A0A4Y2D5N2_ARAVE|nr:hypothetical protein AVEN_256107-1 [Araneus ventricosus]
MNIPTLLACMEISPWFWIMKKFKRVGDVYDMIPLAFFVYLLALHNRSICKDRLDVMKALEDKQQGQKDGFCQKSEEKWAQTIQKTTELSTQCRPTSANKTLWLKIFVNNKYRLVKLKDILSIYNSICIELPQ